MTSVLTNAKTIVRAKTNMEMFLALSKRQECRVSEYLELITGICTEAGVRYELEYSMTHTRVCQLRSKTAYT